MIESLLESLTTLVRRVRANRALSQIAFILVVAIALLSFLGWPWLWKPFLHIPGNSGQFRFDCVPAEISVTLVDSHARISTVELMPVVGDMESTALAIIGFDYSQDGPIAKASLKKGEMDGLASQIPATSDVRYVLKMSLKGVTAVNVQQLTILGGEASYRNRCLSQVLGPSELISMQPEDRARLVRIRPIQSEISNLILDYNDRVANFLVGVMALVTVFYLGMVILFWRRAYFTRDATFSRQIKRRMTEVVPALQKMGSQAVLKADFARIQRRLVFAKNVGPICGFALTVSSLIAALHPAVQIDKDSFSFLSSLQLALVATLVGLAMRLLAEFAIRFNRQTFELQLSLVTEEEAR
jgi:hypothetical protein